MPNFVYVVELLTDEYYYDWSIVLVTSNEAVAEEYMNKDNYIVSRHVLEM